MGINFSFFCFMLNLLPETMPKAQRQKFTWRNLNPFIYCTYDTATQPLLLLLPLPPLPLPLLPPPPRLVLLQLAHDCSHGADRYD
jgi:hypothetical protein